MKSNIYKVVILLFSLAGLVGCGKEQAFTDTGTTSTTQQTATGGATGTGSYTLTAGTLTPVVVVGTTATISAVLTDGDLPVASAPVTFIVDNGRFTGNVTYATVDTDATGTATVDLTAPVFVGSGTVTLSSAGQSTTVSLDYVAGSAARISLGASPNVVGLSSKSTLTTQLTDAYGNPIQNEVMEFAFKAKGSGNPSIEGVSLAPTNSSGIASIVYTSGTTATIAGVDDIITVTPLNGGGTVVAETTITVKSSATTISSLVLDYTLPSTSMPVGTTQLLTATLKDSAGDPTTGQTVAFEIVGAGGLDEPDVATPLAKLMTAVTDTNGVATLTLAAPLLVDSATITASSAGLSSNISLNYVAGEPATVILDASPVTVGVSSDSTLTVQLYDKYGNVAPGEPVKIDFAVDNSVPPVALNESGAFFTPATTTGDANVTTNASGVATLLYTSGIKEGTDSIIATAPNAKVPPSATVDITVSLAASSITSLTLVQAEPDTQMIVGNMQKLTAEVLNSNNKPVAGQSVAFTVAGAGDLDEFDPTDATGQSPTPPYTKTLLATTNTSGIATVWLHAPLQLDSGTITASTAGLDSSVSITYTADAPATAKLTASPATVGVSSDSTLTVLLTDKHGNVTAGEPVVFEFVANDGGVTNASKGAFAQPTATGTANATTDQNGVATVTYTSGATPDVIDRIQVTATNGSSPTDTVDISVSTATTSVASLELALSSPSTFITVADSTVKLNATVLNNLGDPVDGVTVSFLIEGDGSFAGLKQETAVTGAITSGVATVTLTAPSRVGSATITATSGAYSASTAVTYIPDEPARVDLAASLTTVNPASDSTLTATVYDTHGNVTPNQEVVFSITDPASSGSATLTPQLAVNPLVGNALTDSSGVATIVYTSGATPATDKVTATANGVSDTVDIVVSSNALMINGITLTAGNVNMVADGADTTTLRAYVTAVGGAPALGQTVYFTTTAGTLSVASAVTDVNGYAEVTLTSPTSTGTATVRATTGGFNSETTVAFQAGPVANLLTYVYPTTVATGGSFSIEVGAEDADNNRIIDEMITVLLKKESVAASGIYDTVVNSTSDVTNAGGVYSTTMTAHSVYGAPRYQVVVSSTNGKTASAIVTVNDATAIVGALNATISATSLVANGADYATVRATVSDTNANLLPNRTVNFTATAGTLSDTTTAGALTAVSATTDSNGVATVYLTSGTTVGSASVTAEIDGYRQTVSTNFIPGPVATVSLIATPNSLNTGDIANLTATVQDANGNVVVGEAVSFAINPAGSVDPVLTAVNAVTDANGETKVTYTAGSTGGGVTDTVTATTPNGTAGPVDITVNTNAIVVGSISLTSGTQWIVADGADSTGIRATVLDTSGKPVVGQVVDFTTTAGTIPATGTTDSNGQVEVSLISGTRIADVTVWADASGYRASTPLRFIAGPAASVSLSAEQVSLNTGEMTTVTVRVQDANGNPVSESVNLVITAPNSVNPDIPAYTNTSDIDGMIKVVYTAGSTGGVDTITATTPNGTTTTLDITVNTTAVNVGSFTLALGAESIVADGVDNTVVYATLLDNVTVAPISGVDVEFRSTVGSVDADTTPTVATATTDSTGVAKVTLTAGTKAGDGVIYASYNGFTASTAITLTPGGVDHLLTYASPTAVNVGGEFTLYAQAFDANDNRIEDEWYSIYVWIDGLQADGSIGVADGIRQSSEIVDSLHTQPDSDGVLRQPLSAMAMFTSATAYALSVDIDTATTGVNATETVQVTTSGTAAVPGTLSMVALSDTIVADGSSSAAIRATLSDTSGLAYPGAGITFDATAGTLYTDSGLTTLVTAPITTNSSGEAMVYLKSDTSKAVATVSAAYAGFNASAQVRFIAGSPDFTNSGIYPEQSTILADGLATTNVVVSLIDANGNLVEDGTPVTLQSTGGTIAPASTATSSGRATFVITSSTTVGPVTLSLAEYPGITKTMSFGSGVAGSGDPANIAVTVTNTAISVGGVGQTDSTSIDVMLYDETGALATTTVDLIVSFVARPGGGEALSATTYTTNVDDSINVLGVTGSTILNLQAGTLPGPVEIRIEALDNATTPTVSYATAIIPQIAIASGPPHTMVVSAPVSDTVFNEGIGFYSRKGGVEVTDRYGNAVPDGTTIYLGMVDTVIATSTDGATTVTLSQLSDTDSAIQDVTGVSVGANGFADASVTDENLVTRFIELNDRIIIPSARAEDKVRYVTTAPSGATFSLPVNRPYQNTGSFEYFVGAAIRGAQVFGVDAGTGTKTKGIAFTKDGLTEISVTYPANVGTIGMGCGLATNDARYNPILPAGYTGVYLYASSSDDSATALNEGTFCFAPIVGFTMTALPSSFSADPAGSVLKPTLELIDGGDGIHLPYRAVKTFINYATNTGGLSVTVDPASCPYTGIDGTCNPTINVSGGVSGDAATVEFYAGDASVSVSVKIP